MFLTWSAFYLHSGLALGLSIPNIWSVPGMTLASTRRCAYQCFTTVMKGEAWKKNNWWCCLLMVFLGEVRTRAIPMTPTILMDLFASTWLATLGWHIFCSVFFRSACTTKHQKTFTKCWISRRKKLKSSSGKVWTSTTNASLYAVLVWRAMPRS